MASTENQKRYLKKNKLKQLLFVVPDSVFNEFVTAQRITGKNKKDTLIEVLRAFNYR